MRRRSSAKRAETPTRGKRETEDASRGRWRRVTWLSPVRARKPFFPDDCEQPADRFLMISAGGNAMDVGAMLPLPTTRAAALTALMTAALAASSCGTSPPPADGMGSVGIDL